MQKIWLCGGSACDEVILTLPDTAVVKLADGSSKQANALVACTQASLQVDGQDANGHVVYTACCGGDHGNGVVVEHVVGQTGAGHEDRALAVEQVGGVKQLRVTFGTDGSGATVTPTAQEIVDAVAAAGLSFVDAAVGGTGAGLAGLVAATNLAGGLDDGDWFRLPFDSRSVRQVNNRETEA